MLLEKTEAPPAQPPAMAPSSPFLDLILACDDNPTKIQAAYSAHRTARTAQQRAAFLSEPFPGVSLDHYLGITEPSPSPYAPDGTPLDPRNSLVLWGRPPEHVLRLASHLQTKLRDAAPHLWLMPPHRMHLTALEISHSKTPSQISDLVSSLRPHAAQLADYTLTHRARLVKPLVTYDLSGVALSFLPAAGEAVLSPTPSAAGSRVSDGEVVAGDGYTYQHLRHELSSALSNAGVEVQARYQVPSAHVTLARYLSRSDHETPAQREAWVRAVEDVNSWLERQVWDVTGGEFIGEWVVGQERGLDLRCGTVWYGGGRSVTTGEGF